MGEGILGLVGVTLAGAMGELLLPEREQRGARRFFRLLVVLAVLLLLLRPLSGAFDGLQGFFQGEVPELSYEEQDFEKILSDAIQAQSVIDLENGVIRLLESELGIEKGNAAVSCTLTAAGELAALSVRLSGAGLLHDPGEVERFLREKLNCVVEVR